MLAEKSKYNLSFAGCGFLGLYHAGVCGCIQELAPHLYKGQKVSGASAGAMAAVFLVCEVKLADYVQYLMHTINSTRSYLIGPFDPRFKITQHLREGLDLYLPEDAHIRCSGNLHISMTNQATRENYIVYNYKDRKELIQAILCSAYIPIFSGFIPLTFHGEWMIDGALTKNTLELDSNTITISPFSGDADICPRDDWGCGQICIAGTSFLVNPNNIERMINIFWPKSPEELGKLTQLGYNDALHFLIRTGFIKCDLHRCHIVLSKVKVSSPQRKVDGHCKKCRKNTKKALQSALSNSILSNFTPIEEAAEKSFFKYFRLISYVVTIPTTIALQFIQRFIPLLKSSHRHMIGTLLDVVQTLVSLDDILKSAFSKAIELSHKQNFSGEFSEELQMSAVFDSNVLLRDKESEYSGSVESLFGKAELEWLLQQNVDDNETEYYPDENEKAEITPGTVDKNTCRNEHCSTRPEIPGMEDGKMEPMAARGVADGQDCDAQPQIDREYMAVHSIGEIHSEMDQQMMWSYTDTEVTNDTDYYIQ